MTIRSKRQNMKADSEDGSGTAGAESVSKGTQAFRSEAPISAGSHTPGPWEKDRYGSLRGSNGRHVHEYNSGVSLRMTGGDAEAIANASLRNAAPDLLEALKNFVGLGSVMTSGERHKRAEAAIRKATPQERSHQSQEGEG